MRPARWISFAVPLPALIIILLAARAAPAEPTTAPATQGATKSYTFRGHTVTYPQSWRLREKVGGAGPATIYKPAAGGAADALEAIWDFDRKTDRAKRTAEQIRDDVTEALATTMKGFKLKDKSTLTIDNKPAAAVTFEHATVDPPAVSRHVFLPTGDGFVLVIDETAVAHQWPAAGPQLDAITRSLRLPR